MGDWTNLARQRADQLETDLELLRHTAHRLDAEDFDQVRKRLEQVRHDHLEQLITPVGTSAFGAWWTGNQVNNAWFELHQLETDIERLRPDVDDVVTKAKDHVRRELPMQRYVELTARVDAPIDAHDKRVIALELMNLAHRAEEGRHEGERQRQRGVLVISMFMLFAALLTFVLQLFTDQRFVPPPAEGTTASAGVVLLLVMTFGMLGGLVSAMLSLYVSAKPLPPTMWFDPRPMLATAKAVCGVWTAFIGVLAVGSGVLVGTYNTLAAALLLAFLFGYGQQVLTGFLDRRLLDVSRPEA